jgi:hypothetical protein
MVVFHRRAEGGERYLQEDQVTRAQDKVREFLIATKPFRSADTGLLRNYVVKLGLAIRERYWRALGVRGKRAEVREMCGTISYLLAYIFTTSFLSYLSQKNSYKAEICSCKLFIDTS